MRIMDPLPDLRPGNLGGGGIFHQVVKWHAAETAQPGFNVLDANTDICAQTFFGESTFGNFHQLLGGNGDIIALAIYLVRPFTEHLVEFLLRDRHESWMGDPRSIMAIGGLAALVL